MLQPFHQMARTPRDFKAFGPQAGWIGNALASPARSSPPQPSKGRQPRQFDMINETALGIVCGGNKIGMRDDTAPTIENIVDAAPAHFQATEAH
jgi:hypothetical protein